MGPGRGCGDREHGIIFPPDIGVRLIYMYGSDLVSVGYMDCNSVHVSVCYLHEGADDVGHQIARKRDIFTLYQ